MSKRRATATFTATYAVGNICGNPRMTTRQVAADLRRLFGIGADVTGAVEISHSDYKHEFALAAHGTAQTPYNLTTESPIATALPVRRAWTRQLHDGVARVTPGRFNSGLRLDVPVPTLVIVKHPVSGANRRGAAARRTFKMAVRKRLFALDAALTSARIRRANRGGVTVVVLMDSNNIHETVYTPNQVVASHGGLMWITVHPAPGVQVTLEHSTRIPQTALNTDHAFLAREITLTQFPVPLRRG